MVSAGSAEVGLRPGTDDPGRGQPLTFFPPRVAVTPSTSAFEFRRVGPSSQMTQSESVAGLAKGGRFAATAVVGHHASQPTPRRIAGDRSSEERRGALHFLAGPDFRASDTRVIVDAHVNAFPTGAQRVIAEIARNVMSDPLDSGEL
jgi:hypothetical protein